MVVESLSDGEWVKEPPLLVIEVLSPSSLMEDCVVKSAEYVRAGIGQFWTIDPDERILDASINIDDNWRFLLQLVDEHPTGNVALGEQGVAPLDIGKILPS